MDPAITTSGEALLRAWLGLTAAVCNRRMVTGLTFNEAVVCNHLLHQQASDPTSPLTATDLCEKTSLLKSQMNSVLSSLEAQGYLKRQRSQGDRRQVFLTLTEDGAEAYQQAHRQASALLGELVSQIGVETADMLTEQFEHIIAAIQGIQERHQKEGL